MVPIPLKYVLFGINPWLRLRVTNTNLAPCKRIIDRNGDFNGSPLLKSVFY